jgi:uracil DNA glycosylase
MDLLINIGCDELIHLPYCIPFIKYVSTWEHALPINTIIIGQNPYPRDIYHEYGAALSYDESKIPYAPASVRVIAQDLFNYDGTSKQDTIECLRNLWALSDDGVLAINETVFATLMGEDKETHLRGGFESECQVRALQVLISESYFMGQHVIECIGMGKSASKMTSVLRGWSPADLITLRIVSCSNPAALAYTMRDLPSQSITLGNSTASRILSAVVKRYKNMSDKRHARRIQQNEDALKAASDQVVSAAGAMRTEYASFADRLRKAKVMPEAKATIDDLIDALTSSVTVLDRHTNAVGAYTIAMALCCKSVATGNQHGKAASDTSMRSGAASPNPLPPPQTATYPFTPKKRPVRKSAGGGAATSSPLVVPPESIAEESVAETQRETEIPRTGTPASTTMKRPVRRVIRKSTGPASVAGTEYTAAESSISEAIVPTEYGSEVGLIQKVHMRSIASWFATNMGDDTTYSEMLESSASTGTTTSNVARKVLGYIQSRLDTSAQYDAYMELEDPSSATSIWCSGYAQELQK